MEQTKEALQGWQCPCCGTVYSPNISVCYCSKWKRTPGTLPDTNPSPWWPYPPYSPGTPQYPWDSGKVYCSTSSTEGAALEGTAYISLAKMSSFNFH